MKHLFQTIKYECKRQPFKMGLFCFCLFLLMIFEVWDYFSPLPARDWIATNLQKIQTPDPNDFSFVVFGDNKNSHATFEGLLRQVDHEPDVAFAIDLGDLVYDGEKQKYRYFFNQVRTNLTLPLLTAIGNHELRENGRGLYYEIFGPFYYSFRIGRNYFIVLDDANEKGLDLWQNRWLEEQLRIGQDFSTRFVFMHVPLFDPRGGMYHHSIPQSAAAQLAVLFRQYRVTHIFASHIHGYFTGQWQGIPYTITGGAGGELFGRDPRHYFYHYLRVHVKDGLVDIHVQRVPSPDYEWLDRFGLIAWAYLSAFLRFHGIELALILLAGWVFVVSWRSRAKREE